MYDLREHKELISQLVSEANQNEHGETMNSEIVEDKELPYLNTPLAEAITLMVHAIRNTAHACY